MIARMDEAKLAYSNSRSWIIFMSKFQSFAKRLNTRPVMWTLIVGISVYTIAFWVTVLAFIVGNSPVYEFGFIFSGSLVMAYHWTISRYLTGSMAAQAIQLGLGLTLVMSAMGLIGAVTHHKAYEWINGLLYLSLIHI